MTSFVLHIPKYWCVEPYAYNTSLLQVISMYCNVFKDWLTFSHKTRHKTRHMNLRITQGYHKMVKDSILCRFAFSMDRLYEYWGNEWEEANACSDADDSFLNLFSRVSICFDNLKGYVMLIPYWIIGST